MTSEAFKTSTEPGQWVTVRQATRLLNVSEKTVYNRINRGEYTSRDNGKTTEVYLLTEWLQGDSEVIQKPSEDYSKTEEAVQKLSEKMIELSERVLKMTETVSERDNTISNLNAAIQRKMLPAVSEPSKDSEALLKRIEELETALRAERRPWWRFW